MNKQVLKIVVVGVVVSVCSWAEGAPVQEATWQPMDSPTTENLLGIWGTASDDIYAVGNAATIIHYDGTGWYLIDTGAIVAPTVQLWGVCGSGPDYVWVAGHNSTILRYDGIWSKIALPDHIPSNIAFEDIWVSGSHVFAGGYISGMAHVVHWDGQSWSHWSDTGPFGFTSVYNVWGRSPDDVYVTAIDGYSWSSKGIVYHYDGSDWTVFYPNPGGPTDMPKVRGVMSIWGTNNSSELFLGAQAFGGPSDVCCQALHYYGDDWATGYDPTKWETEIFEQYADDAFVEVWGSSLDDIYMIAFRSGTIFHTNSDFSDWTFNKVTTEQLMGIWGNGPCDVYAVGSNGTILRLFEPVIFVEIDIDPDTLNLNSNDMWITCYIELPGCYDVIDIDGSTVMLDDIAAYIGKEGWARAGANTSNIMDHDEDGISERMVKFDRSAVQAYLTDLGQLGDVELLVSGELIGGPTFEGTDIIKVINKGK